MFSFSLQAVCVMHEKSNKFIRVLHLYLLCSDASLLFYNSTCHINVISHFQTWLEVRSGLICGARWQFIDEDLRESSTKKVFESSVICLWISLHLCNMGFKAFICYALCLGQSFWDCDGNMFFFPFSIPTFHYHDLSVYIIQIRQSAYKLVINSLCC